MSKEPVWCHQWIFSARLVFLGSFARLFPASLLSKTWLSYPTYYPLLSLNSLDKPYQGSIDSLGHLSRPLFAPYQPRLISLPYKPQPLCIFAFVPPFCSKALHSLLASWSCFRSWSLLQIWDYWSHFPLWCREPSVCEWLRGRTASHPQISLLLFVSRGSDSEGQRLLPARLRRLYQPG